MRLAPKSLMIRASQGRLEGVDLGKLQMRTQFPHACNNLSIPRVSSHRVERRMCLCGRIQPSTEPSTPAATFPDQIQCVLLTLRAELQNRISGVEIYEAYLSTPPPRNPSDSRATEKHSIDRGKYAWAGLFVEE
jgi:hypothetical protein